jgi:hypothetical protein
MEHIITRRRGFRKLLAFLLCMASILGLLPAQAFAMSVGQTASSWLGDQYVGSDGNHYRAPAPYTYLAYHADGTIDVHTSSGGNAYRHYMLTDSDGISHQVYYVESGIPYHTSENTYVFWLFRSPGRKPSPCAVSSGQVDDFAPALFFVQSVPPSVLHG